MKTQSNFLVPLSSAVMDKLRYQVKETLYLESPKKESHFNAVDLWNIQRHFKGLYSRRRYM